MLHRRAVLALAGSALAAPALAQSGVWPQAGRTVKIIVPWPPGAANDALGRLVANRIQEKFGVASVVENRTGGAGLIGTTAVLQADPDGYTLLASAFNTAVMPMVLKGANFDPETDLEVMARTAVAPLVCVMSAARPQTNMQEVIAAARANPSSWNFAVPALGAAGHLATIDFVRRTGVPFDLIPYRGTAPALQDIMSGNAHLLIDNSFGLIPSVREGNRVRGLGIATRARSALAPELPTMAEAGLPGFEFSSWYGVWGPKGTPRVVIDTINALVRETMSDPAIVARLTNTLIEPVVESVDDTKRFIRSEIERARELLRLVNFQPA